MRLWLRALFGLMVVMGLSEPARADTDLSTIQPSEIEALQKRLTDDGCYAGPIDGLASAATNDAVKACPDQQPVLRIETGMHVSTIRRIGVDDRCQMMVTGSEDKTLRVWSLPDGRLQKVIRLPIGQGNGGKIYAASLSPDGRFVAAGGWDGAYEKGKGHGLYLIDLASGNVRRVGAYEGVINSISISSDGARVAMVLGAAGVRVIEAATGNELLADRDYGADSYGVSFAADGSLYATSLDGFLRRYGPDLRLTAKVKAPGGSQPFEIAVDPSGRRLAVGYEDTAKVSILDARTLKLIAKGNTTDLTDSMFSVAWMPDGRKILAAGLFSKQSNGVWRDFTRSFDAGGRRLGDTPISKSSVFDLKPCGTGIAYAAADPAFGIINSDGSARILQDPTTADMRDKRGDDFAVSPDGTSLRFGLDVGAEKPVLFDLRTATLVDAPAKPFGLSPVKADGLPVTDWLNRTDPKFNGRLISTGGQEWFQSLAIRSDLSGFVLGTEWALHSFDANAQERWNIPAPAPTWGVNFASAGRLIVAAYGDGTIRWHRWSDGQELLALFVKPDTRSWVAWTPSGYYMASPGAEEMIGWHVNRGWEQQADFFPASRFRDKFNRPDVVRAVLNTLDEAEAIKQANADAGRTDDQRPIIERLPPVITIVSPSTGSTVAPGMVEIRYRTRTPSGGAVDRVEAFVDGAKIQARGLGPAADPSSDADGSTVLTLPMPDHDAEISLVAYAGGKASDAARIQLKGTIQVSSSLPAADDDMLKPTLYALVIGVAHYEAKSYDLAYPAQDALGLAEALKSQKGKLYKDVVLKVLTDEEATTTAVKRGLSWLRKQTTAHDLAIVFAAGHGTTDAKGKFWFLTYDMDPDDIGATAVSRDDISDVLFDLPGKKLLFLDACHSGAALNAGARGESDVSLAISDFAQTEGGVVAYAASTGREFSFERPEWGHGAFTKALIEGFTGKADILHKGTVTTASLDLFLENRVKELTGGLQHPVMTRPKTVPDFPIAMSQ